jgi:hypothetical protein
VSLAPFALLNSLSKKIFDLAVDAAQFVLCPGLKIGPEFGVNSKQKWFSSHRPDLSAVKRAGIKHGMNFGFTTEHDHKIADHGGLALVVEHQHLLLG